MLCLKISKRNHLMKGHTGPKDVVGMNTAMRPSDATFVFKEGKVLGFPMKCSKQCHLIQKISHLETHLLSLQSTCRARKI